MISKKLINFKKIKKFIIIEIFYKNYIWFVDQGSPWFLHGYHFIVGGGAGIFAFDHGSGYGYQDGSFRGIYYELVNL